VTTALNCLVFEKIAFFCILATDKQTDKQMDSSDTLSRGLNNIITIIETYVRHKHQQ